MNIDAEIQNVISAADTSAWLRQALQTAVERDPADAANDAERLSELLARRFDTTVRELHPTMLSEQECFMYREQVRAMADLRKETLGV